MESVPDIRIYPDRSGEEMHGRGGAIGSLNMRQKKLLI